MPRYRNSDDVLGWFDDDDTLRWTVGVFWPPSDGGKFGGKRRWPSDVEILSGLLRCLLRKYMKTAAAAIRTAAERKEREMARMMTWRWADLEGGWGKRREEMLAGNVERTGGAGGGGGGEGYDGKKGF